MKASLLTRVVERDIAGSNPGHTRTQGLKTAEENVKYNNRRADGSVIESRQLKHKTFLNHGQQHEVFSFPI